MQEVHLIFLPFAGDWGGEGDFDLGVLEEARKERSAARVRKRSGAGEEEERREVGEEGDWRGEEVPVVMAAVEVVEMREVVGSSEL
ncbi:hypothetical protein HS088_TW02G00230 [Tripterygium wilfordii]|uniref:Uncharacterized protein n=1 Tax=Tripterygium wilfordii TaxID=458696 RepID=A0A7J7DXV5_TRIWF|nr:hypothetical protein HS088_TW02G00230 [Tripterygium wilfordii]